MRILCWEEKDISLNVMEVTEVYYNENCDGCNNEGLCFSDTDEVDCYIAGITKGEAENLLSQLLRNGYVDLTQYNQYEVFDY